MTNDNFNNPTTDPELTSALSTDDLDGIADIEKYVLHSKGEIVQKLRLLSKSKSSITGYLNSGKDFFLTAVIDVLRDKNILILDIGNDTELNAKIAKSERIVFKTKHLGITAQFKISSIQTAKYKGQQFFACAIPDDLLWVQRRAHFRVRIPLSDNAVFQIKNDDGDLVEYRIIDISGGGLAIADEAFSLQVEAGDEFKNCNLIFENDLSTTTNLLVQNILPLDFKNEDSGQRVGCMFQLLRTDFSADLQRYINLLDSHYRKTLTP